jgi:uncharacterized protein (TIGR03083 family)
MESPHSSPPSGLGWQDEAMPGQGALTALVDENGALSTVLRQLRSEEFDQPTNCPPWSLAELVVHIAMSIRFDDADLPAAAPLDAPLWTAADYYRRPERDTQPYRQGNVDSTQRVAGPILATTSAAQWFDQVCAATEATLSRRDLGQTVQVSGIGPMVLADYVTTRVMSVAAHGLDVALTLGRPGWTTRAALDEVRPVLVSLLGEPPPAALGWDDQTLLAVGTGRRALTDAERTILGPAQDRFPLLS